MTCAICGSDDCAPHCPGVHGGGDEGTREPHPAGEPGTDSRRQFDDLVSRADEARRRGESFVPLVAGERADAIPEAALNAAVDALLADSGLPQYGGHRATVERRQRLAFAAAAPHMAGGEDTSHVCRPGCRISDEDAAAGPGWDDDETDESTARRDVVLLNQGPGHTPSVYRRHLADGPVTLCGIELAGVTIPDPPDLGTPLECATCRQRAGTVRP